MSVEILVPWLEHQYDPTKNLKAAAGELRRLQECVKDLEAQLILEAKHTAEYKLRAEQLDKQHSMQCAMRRGMEVQLLARIQELESEAEQNAKIIGASAETELALRGRIAEMEKQMAAIGAGGVVPVLPAAAPLTPDDVAVDALAVAMKAKLAKQRSKGYGGWDTVCTQQYLSDLLRSHVDKGDPVDVANFCAFLSARGEGISTAHQTATSAPVVSDEQIKAVFLANGFTIKEGLTDLKPYVYQAARALLASAGKTQELDERDAAFEAVRKVFCKLQRYSFFLDGAGNVRRCADHCGNWVEFDAVHTLFERQSVDAALAAQAKQGRKHDRS